MPRSLASMIVALAVLALPVPALPCSLALLDIGPPAVDGGFDPARSAPAPAITGARVVDEGLGGDAGCGAQTSCDGVVVRYLEIQTPRFDEIDRLKVRYPDGTTVYNAPSFIAEGIATYRLEVGSRQAPLRVFVTSYDLEGYESGTSTVDIHSNVERGEVGGGCRVSSRAGGFGALLLVVLLGWLGAWPRRSARA